MNSNALRAMLIMTMLVKLLHQSNGLHRRITWHYKCLMHGERIMKIKIYVFLLLFNIEPYCICAFTMVYVRLDVSFKFWFVLSWWFKIFSLSLFEPLILVYIRIFFEFLFELHIIKSYVLTPIMFKYEYWTRHWTKQNNDQKRSTEMVRKKKKRILYWWYWWKTEPNDGQLECES